MRTPGENGPAWRRLDSVEMRFLLAGGLAAGINWIARFPLELVMPFAIAVLGALAIGMTSGFLLYDRWVFPGSPHALQHKIRDFIAVNLASQAVMFVMAVGLRELALLAAVPKLIAGAAAHLIGIGMGAFVSFIGHRAVTFGRER